MNYPPYNLSNRSRSVIFAVFTAIFLIVAPSLALYTAGYRFNTGSFGLSRIGVLSVDITPKDATTFLNNKIVGTNLPLRLTNLVPGTYHLRIEKSGFLPFIKDIVIEQNKTTYIKDLGLFSTSTPEPVEMNDTLNDIFGSTDGNYILEKFGSSDETKFVLFDTTQELTTQIPTPTFTPDTIFWSEKNNLIALLARTSSVINISVIAANNIEDSTNLTITGAFQDYQWKENFYSENLLLHVDNFLYKVDPKDDAPEAEDIHTTSSIFFRESNNNDWYFEPANQTLVHANNKKENIILPTANIKKIVDINNNRAIVQTPEGLTIIKRDETKEIKNISTPNFFYDENRKEYIAWSPWELWTVYQNGQVTLLNRMSEAIVQVATLDQTGELLVITADKLLGFNPGYYLTQEILSGVNIEKTTVNEKTRTIYFLGTWQGKKGLYKLKY